MPEFDLVSACCTPCSSGLNLFGNTCMGMPPPPCIWLALAFTCSKVKVYKIVHCLFKFPTPYCTGKFVSNQIEWNLPDGVGHAIWRVAAQLCSTSLDHRGTGATHPLQTLVVCHPWGGDLFSVYWLFDWVFMTKQRYSISYYFHYW